ncbi:MAG: cytochrome c oxidase assembly protein [Amylibacter sp.]|nr:cytochrome c oxidase assembly protein [Amylibacter sp.]
MSQDKNTKMLIRLSVLVFSMLAFSFAAVPFYNWFCRVTGFAGVTQVAAEASDTILDQTIEIRFDGSLERGMPWDFKPEHTTMTLKIGETGLAFYEAYNPTDKVIAGTASYNVFPYSAGAYFTKIDCFCFEMQVLQPGERVMMPVTFYVDPDIINDPDAKYAKTITLSYTFHVTDLPEEELALRAQTNIKTIK